jgi:hypothetical protein
VCVLLGLFSTSWCLLRFSSALAFLTLCSEVIRVWGGLWYQRLSGVWKFNATLSFDSKNRVIWQRGRRVWLTSTPKRRRVATHFRQTSLLFCPGSFIFVPPLPFCQVHGGHRSILMEWFSRPMQSEFQIPVRAQRNQ